VAAAKGQVRVSQLDEKGQDNNVRPARHFDVPATQSECDKVLPTRRRGVAATRRAGPGESATDRKWDYADVKSGQRAPRGRSRSTVTASTASRIPKLHKIRGQLKGHVRALQLNEKGKEQSIRAPSSTIGEWHADDLAVLDKRGDADEVGRGGCAHPRDRVKPVKPPNPTARWAIGIRAQARIPRAERWT